VPLAIGPSCSSENPLSAGEGKRRRTAPFFSFITAGFYLLHPHLGIDAAARPKPISGTYGKRWWTCFRRAKYIPAALGPAAFFIDYSYLPGRCSFWVRTFWVAWHCGGAAGNWGLPPGAAENWPCSDLACSGRAVPLPVSNRCP